MKELIKDLKKKQHIDKTSQIEDYKQELKRSFYNQLLYVFDESIKTKKIDDLWSYLELKDGYNSDIAEYASLIRHINDQELGIVGKLYVDSYFIDNCKSIVLEEEVLL